VSERSPRRTGSERGSRKRTKWDDETAPPPLPQPQPVGPAPGTTVPAPGFKVLQIPANQKGALIGRGGAAITAIRQASMSEVKVSHSEGEALATITITGNVALAEDLINQQLEQVRRPKSIQWEVRLVDVPQELVGLTIGTGGSNLREMKDKSGCQIAFVQARDYDETAPEGKQLARIKGPPEKVPEAEQLLIEKVQEVQQIHLNKSMGRQMWAGCGQMPMGGGMDHMGATSWSHWGDGMQSAQRWMEDPDGPYNAFDEAPMVGNTGGWHEDMTGGWHQDPSMGWHDGSAAWYPAACPKAHDPGPQAVSKSAMASSSTSSRDRSNRDSGSRGPGPCNNTGDPNLGQSSGGAESSGTKTEAKRSNSSNVNRGSSNPFHRDAAAGSQATGAGEVRAQAPIAAATGMEFMGGSHSQASEGPRSPAIGAGACGTGMNVGGPQWPEGGTDGIEGMDGMGAEAWARSNTRQQAHGFVHDAAMGMGALIPAAEPDNYKMEYCKYWDSGKCSRGAHCTFAHGIDELRGGLTPKNLRIMEEAQQMMMAMDPRGPHWPEETLNKDSQWQQPATKQQDNVPAAFRTAAFQQRLQTGGKGTARTQQWP